MNTPRLVTSPTRTILVGSDFSEEADRALSWAVDLAQRMGAAIEVAHVNAAQAVVLPPPIDVLPVALTAPSGDEAATAPLAARVASVAQRGIPVSSWIGEGDPAIALKERADELGASLVVVGSRGSSGLAHVLLGSVAERVIRHATRPVLVVPRAPALRHDP